VKAAKAPVLADRYRLDWRFFRPKIDIATERKVRKQRAKGVGILKVAKSLGIGTQAEAAQGAIAVGRVNHVGRLGRRVGCNCTVYDGWGRGAGHR
jgi:hypothetical protein